MLLVPFVIVAMWHHMRFASTHDHDSLAKRTASARSASHRMLRGELRRQPQAETADGAHQQPEQSVSRRMLRGHQRTPQDETANVARQQPEQSKPLTQQQQEQQQQQQQQQQPALRILRQPVRHSGDESAECAPVQPDATSTGPRLDWIVPRDASFPTNCDRPSEGIPELCDALRRVAINREVLVPVCDSNVMSQLELFLQATSRAGVTNVLVIALDQILANRLKQLGVAYWLRADSAKGSHKISAQKFKLIGALLSVGASVLVSDIDVIYVQDPFRFLHRDSDVEGTTDGWDAATAYGWTEQVNDAPIGWAANTYTHRSTAYNSGLWFIQATLGGQRLLKLLAHRMATETTWDQTAYNEEVCERHELLH